MKTLILALFLLVGSGVVAQTPLYPARYTVATLPAASSLTNKIVSVTDSLTQGSCTVGGGTFTSPCRSDGTNWVPWGDGITTGTSLVTDVSGTLPIASTHGTTPAISIADAGADGSTKGAASFTANDFNALSGNISLDYTNGQAASASLKGFLAAADWSTFNSKESALTFSTGLTRSTNTITVNTTQNIAKLSNLTSNGFVKTSGGDGTLSVDTATYALANRNINTSSPLTGGGDLSADRTLACATCVVASSPGVGVAHFAGSTQTVTSSLIVNADITNGTIDLTAKVTGTLPANLGGTGVSNAGTISNSNNIAFTGGGTFALGGWTFTVPATGTAVLTSRALTAGAGLTGGGDLSADRSFALTTPGTLTVSTTNSSTGSHTHAITSSSNPGAAASLLASDSSGFLRLVRLGLGMAPSRTLDVTGTFGVTSTGTFGADVLPSLNYTSNLGALATKYLTLHAAELWVETLVAQNTMATIGGRVLVAPTTPLSADLAAAGTTITVKYNNLSNGDRVYMEASGKVEFMAVTSTAGGSAGAYTYSVTRNLDGSGANDWYAGDAVLNTGTTGNGYIDLYSVSGVIPGSTAGPTIVGNVRTGTTYNNIEPRWAIGNLNGLYGYSGSTYGAAFGTASGAWLKIDPTNGVRIGYNSSTFTQIDASGNASFTGTVTAAAGAIGGWTITSSAISSSGIGIVSSATAANNIIYSGSGVYNHSGTPFYLDGSGRFSLKDKLTFDGTNLVLAGSITSTSGSIAGWTINSTYINSSSVYVASNFDPPAGAVSWFGKYTAGHSGVFFRDSGGKAIELTNGNAGIYPYLGVHDGTRYRIIIGGLNSASWPGGSTSDMGMKIGDATGNLLAEFGSTNTIAGWVIETDTIRNSSSTVKLRSAGNLAFGSTPPTSSSVGTGLWIDSTGITSLNGSSKRFVLDSSDITLYGLGRLKFNDGTNQVGNVIGSNDSADTNFVAVQAAGAGGTYTNALVQLRTDYVSGQNAVLELRSLASGSNIQIYAGAGTFSGLTLGANAAPNAMLDVRGTAVVTGRVGIGTTGPSAFLDVKGAGSTAAFFNFSASSGGTGLVFGTLANTGGTAYLGLEDSGPNSIATGALGYALLLGHSGSQATQLFTNSVVRMTIDSAGNVGIGTTSPGSKLQITGGNLSVTGTNSLRLYGVGIQGDPNTEYVDFFHNGASGVSLRIDKTGTGTNRNFNIVLGGTAIMTFTAGGGVQVGSPTGGDKGAGTLNASAVYDDNVLLTDWLLTPGGKPDKSEPYRRLFALEETRKVIEDEHRLPWMPRVLEFERERHLGGMVTRLWQGQEQQQKYILELEDRIKQLEQKTTKENR